MSASGTTITSTPKANARVCDAPNVLLELPTIHLKGYGEYRNCFNKKEEALSTSVAPVVRPIHIFTASIPYPHHHQNILSITQIFVYLFISVWLSVYGNLNVPRTVSELSNNLSNCGYSIYFPLITSHHCGKDPLTFTITMVAITIAITAN